MGVCVGVGGSQWLFLSSEDVEYNYWTRVYCWVGFEGAEREVTGRLSIRKKRKRKRVDM